MTRPKFNRPTWDDTKTDLSQHKLSVQEQKKRYLVQQKYNPTIVTSTCNSIDPLWTKSTNKRDTSGWPTTVSPLRNITQTNKQNDMTTTATTNSSSSSILDDPDLAPICTTNHIHHKKQGMTKSKLIPSTSYQHHSSTKINNNHNHNVQKTSYNNNIPISRYSYRNLHHALNVAHHIIQDKKDIHVNSWEIDTNDDEIDSMVPNDELAMDQLVDLASSTVTQFAYSYQSLQRQLNMECDLRRRLEVQVHELVDQISQMKGTIDKLQTSTSTQMNEESSHTHTQLLSRINALELSNRDRELNDQVNALDQLFDSFDL